MRSVFKGKECPVFPKLMVCFDGGQCVVLFTAPGEGVSVYSWDGKNPVGEYSRDWDMDVFDDFTGEVILKGDPDEKRDSD